MYQLLTITGADALEFLQGQLTQDVASVTADESRLSAWCNPKGRVLATMRLLRTDNGFAMILLDDLGSTVQDRLAMFRFRAQVDFSTPADWRGLATDSEQDIDHVDALQLLPAPGHSTTQNGIHAVRLAGNRDIVELFGSEAAFASAGVAIQAPLSDTEWLAARIEAGIADIGATNTERFTPHMLNLDKVAAVSFDKGCYVGQEIVARTENLGRSRRRMAAFRAAEPGIRVGDKVATEEREVGEVVRVAEQHLLAVLPTDHHQQSLRVGEVAVVPLKLPYDVSGTD